MKLWNVQAWLASVRHMYRCQHIDALKPNGLLYISWPLLLNICSLWTFSTSIIKPPGERIIKKAHRPYWFFKLPHTRTARRILLQTSQTRKFPALAATSAPYTTIGPVHQQMVLQHSPQIASISKISMPLEEHVLIEVQDPNQPLGASNHFPPKINTRIWKISQCSETLPPHPLFVRNDQWPPFPKISQADASHFR